MEWVITLFTLYVKVSAFNLLRWGNQTGLTIRFNYWLFGLTIRFNYLVAIMNHEI